MLLLFFFIWALTFPSLFNTKWCLWCCRPTEQEQATLRYLLPIISYNCHTSKWAWENVFSRCRPPFNPCCFFYYYLWNLRCFVWIAQTHMQLGGLHYYHCYLLDMQVDFRLGCCGYLPAWATLESVRRQRRKVRSWAALTNRIWTFSLAVQRTADRWCVCAALTTTKIQSVPCYVSHRGASQR